jgi:hypothetical protein
MINLSKAMASQVSEHYPEIYTRSPCAETRKLPAV